MNPEYLELLNQVENLILKPARKANIDAYEVDVSLETGFTATARMGSVENLEHHRDRSLTITVYKDQRTGVASTSDLSPAALQEVLTKACSIACYAEPDPFSGLADKALMAYDFPDLALFYPWEITPEKAIELAIQCDEAARSKDKRIIQTEEAMLTTNNHFRIYANSHDFLGYYPTTSHGLSLSVIAEEKGQMERDYDACYSHLATDLKKPTELAEIAVNRTINRLNARKISTRRCPIIFKARVAKSLLRHFIHAITGGNLYRHHSFLLDKLGDAIFPSFIEIYQQPHIKGGHGSAPFDAEGVKTRDIHYVEHGILSQYSLGSYSARKLGLTTTGNAGGVHNLFISTDEKNLRQLCAEIQTGLLVTELMGQGVNLLTGNYSRGAVGFWIENGEIQYPVHEITIAGNLKDMFANIIAVGNDVDIHANIRTGSIAIAEMVVAGN